MNLNEKIEQHQQFWKGEGPSLILIPPARDMHETWQDQIYDTSGYREKFYNPEMMWESEISRARPVTDWPTDGIPTVRPNLGVVFLPSMAGQDYVLREGMMPWAGEALSPEQIRKALDKDLSGTELIELAEQFYRIHREKGDGEVAAYQADNQGIFDIAHLLYGDQIFYDLMDENQWPWVDELLDISRELMVRACRYVKQCIGEGKKWMMHGHGTEQGFYFPDSGLRISEDTPAMIAPDQLDRFVMGSIERCAEEFGSIFMHYCGNHEYFFERLCRSDAIGAIDLGNPESYDTRWLLEMCAETDTVLYSRVAPLEEESRNGDWQAYIRRLAKLVNETGARCILRPLVFPSNRDECVRMLDMWHELTG